MTTTATATAPARAHRGPDDIAALDEDEHDWQVTV